MTKGFLCDILLAEYERKGVFEMIAMSSLSSLHKDMSLVLPEPQYLVFVRVHSAKLETQIHQGLC